MSTMRNEYELKGGRPNPYATRLTAKGRTELRNPSTRSVFSGVVRRAQGWIEPAPPPV
jgi:hypothetical protein